MVSFQSIVVILLVSGSNALYDASPDVIKLTPDNFEELVTNSTEVWIVMFYAPWCGWSKVAVPEYTKAACALKGIAKLGAIDAYKYDAFGQLYGANRYPTIKVFTGSKHAPYEYERKAASYVLAVVEAAKERATANLNEGACKLLGDNSDNSSSESQEEEKVETTTETFDSSSSESQKEEKVESTTETYSTTTEFDTTNDLDSS